MIIAQRGLTVIASVTMKGAAQLTAFPETPRVPRSVRLGAIVIALVALGYATIATVQSISLVGRVFPGFLITEPRILMDQSSHFVVIGPLRLSHWASANTPSLSFSWLVAMDGEAVTSAADVYAKLAARGPGVTVRYRLRQYGTEREVVLPTQRFTTRDWLMLFGPLLLNAAVFLGCGIAGWVLRPRDASTKAFLAFCGTVALIMFSILAVYSPAHVAHLQYLLPQIGIVFLPGALLHLVLVLPEPGRYGRWRFGGYVLSFVALVVFETSSLWPLASWQWWSPDWLGSAIFTVELYGLSVGLFGLARLILAYRSGPSQLVRERLRLVILGATVGLGPTLVVGFMRVILRLDVSRNAAVIFMPLFPACLGYAVVKHELLEIDAATKRTTYYLLVSAAIVAAYIGAAVIVDISLQQQVLTNSLAFPVMFTLAVLFLFDPLRKRVQRFIDRAFFGVRYDGARALASVGAQLAGALARDQIAAIVQRCVDDTIPNSRTRLFTTTAADGRFSGPDGSEDVDGALIESLAQGRVLTTADSAESYRDGAMHRAVQSALARLDAEIAVPLQLQGTLVGVLMAGSKRSGLYYTAVDAEFLQALAQEAAIALQNAASYETVVALNATLEEQVRARTAQLVQAEKLAALGRLVAGVAHEINNPVSFVASTVAPLRERLEAFAAAAPPDLQEPLREAEELVEIMARGAERTATIVKDLRSFSRINEDTRKPVDLHEGLEVSLRLLAPRWREHITVHRDYGTLPPVECDAGQLNQVFMNVLANACDAIAERGNIWVTTRAEGDAVRITIRDDGCGMVPEIASRVFDPFFTTKDVGGGTGLGLALSHSIVAAHGGRIEVDSAPGVGATFHVVLPILARAKSARTAAAGG